MKSDSTQHSIEAHNSNKDVSEWRTGWRTALASALGYGAGVTLFTNTATITIAPIMRVTGWTTTQVIIAPLIITLAGLLSPFVGWLLEEVEIRLVALFGHLGLIATLVTFSTLIPLTRATYLLFAIALGIFGSCAYLVTFSRAISSWFDRSVGKAFGMLGVAGSGIPALSTPIVAFAVYNYGWRAAYLVVALIMFIVAVPAVLWALKLRKPLQPVVRCDVGSENTASERKSSPNCSQTKDLSELGHAFKTPRLWFLGLWCMLVAAAMTGFASNMQPLMLDAGKSVIQATTATSLFFVSVLCGRLLMGFLLDLTSRYLLAIVTFIVSIGGAIILANGKFLQFPFVLLGTVMLAVGQGAEADLMSYFVLKEFGRERFATMFGAFIPMITFGALTGPYLFGWLRDKTGTYELSCYTSALLFGIATVLVTAFGWSGRAAQTARTESGSAAAPSLRTQSE
jgi:MFS family permease